MWEVVEKLLKVRKWKIADLQRATGIPYSTFTDWKAGRYTPKLDKIQKVADAFGVTVEYIMTGENPPEYIFDDETAELAQELLKNKELRALMYAARKSSPQDVQLATDMLKRFKETNPNG